jgi:hypothetical protein
MEFLTSAWNWVCGIAKTVCSYLTSYWDWVKNEVQKAWDVLKEKSLPFREMFSLRLLVKRVKAKYHELRNKLSKEEQDELDDLLRTIDARD